MIFLIVKILFCSKQFLSDCFICFPLHFCYAIRHTSLCVSLSLCLYSFSKQVCSLSKFHSKLLCIFFLRKKVVEWNVLWFFVVPWIYLILFMFLWSCLVYCLEGIHKSTSLCAQCLCIVDNYFKVQEEIRKC